jgi:hypothetical protein
MSGTVDVDVKTGVGDSVAEGVRVGGSGVSVDASVKVGQGVWVSGIPTGTPAAAVCVAAEIMVDIIAVPRKLTSWVGAGRLGTAQATETSNKAVTDKRMGVGFRIAPPFGFQNEHKPKSADSSAASWDAALILFVPDLPATI